MLCFLTGSARVRDTRFLLAPTVHKLAHNVYLENRLKSTAEDSLYSY